MGSFRSAMAIASLSTVLWRAEARLFAPPRAASFHSRSRLGAAATSSSRDCPCLAFRNGGAAALRSTRRCSTSSTVVATAFSQTNGRSTSSPRDGKPSAAQHRRSRRLSASTTPRAQAEEGAPPPPVPQNANEEEEPRKRSTRGQVPTILLAGFLGSGKTSTLKHLLENNSDLRIGTIVNDVAAVNIDAKLVVGGGGASNSVGDDDNRNAEDGVVELQNGCACCSIADELFMSVRRLTRDGERELDAIVVELSGVADPVAVRDNWKQAELDGHPATRLARISRTITLVDACTFGTDWMTWDKAGERPSWDSETDNSIHASVRNVPELLAEQVEAADLLLVNKIDLAGEGQVGIVTEVARGLNEKASVMEVEFGRVDARELLGKLEKDEGETQQHSHDHEHSHGHSDETSHSHSHSHSHDHDAEECTDPSHSHSHEHASECDDPDCTDASHSHSHDHGGALAENHLGISSFVYSSTVPFNSQRLLALLNQWPIPIKDSLEIGTLDDDNEIQPGQNKAFAGVLRSKGFCWMSPTHWSTAPGNDVWRHDTAMFWSHAGKHFGINAAGKWWGCLSKDQIKPFFANNMEEYDRIMDEDWKSEEWGDRRQEIVFIGVNLDEQDIRSALDGCLCTEEEMVEYRASLKSYMDAMS